MGENETCMSSDPGANPAKASAVGAKLSPGSIRVRVTRVTGRNEERT